MVAGGTMTVVKTNALSVAMHAVALGPALSQELQLQSTIQIDCSAYQRNADGSWAVLRANKILDRGKVWREVDQGEELEKLTDGAFLFRLLDASCPAQRSDMPDGGLSPSRLAFILTKPARQRGAAGFSVREWLKFGLA